MTYGYERLRFIKPVFIGDTIKVTITIKDKKDHKKTRLWFSYRAGRNL